MDKFLTELRQQPDAIRAVTGFYFSEDGKSLLEAVELKMRSEKCSQILFTGMGSSYFLSRAAAAMMPKWGVPVCAEDSGELLHENFEGIVPGTLLVPISQSGESYEVKVLLERLKQENVELAGVIGITNNPDSSLAKGSDICLPLFAGEEHMTSSKTFVNTYLVILALTQMLKGREMDAEAVLKMADEAARILADSSSFKAASEVINNSTFVQCIARGPIKSVSDQTSLMFMEVCKLPSSSMSGGSFRHGPIEAVDNSFTTVLFTHSNSGTYSQSIRLVGDILGYGGKVILVSDCQSDIKNDNLTEITISCADAPMALPLLIMPLQMIANQVALDKGIEPGSFSHGNKITAIE